MQLNIEKKETFEACGIECIINYHICNAHFTHCIRIATRKPSNDFCEK